MRRTWPTLRKQHAAALAGAVLGVSLLVASGRAEIIALDGPQPVDFQQQGAMAWGGDEFIANGPVQIDDISFRGRRYLYTEQMMRSQIDQALQTPRSPGMDTWAWRDSVEARLMGNGPGGVVYMRQQMLQRDGYGRDALQVAIFRLENPPLFPNGVLQTWVNHFFNLPDAEPQPYKIVRVLDVRDVVGLRELFPHHLFYAIDYPAKKSRVVVALAADAMVQPLQDDAALSRFVHNEAPPQLTQVGKERLSAAAALLAAARSSTIYKPDRLRVEGIPPTFTITLDAAALHQTLTATFNPTGTLQTLSTGQEKVEVKPAPPVVVPTAVAPPPDMPG